MTLLKGDDTVKPRPPIQVEIVSWPKERRPEGIGISIKDLWNGGIGFGLAMAIAVPLILMLLSCVIGIAITILGGSLGALL